MDQNIFRQCFIQACRAMPAHRDELCKLDSFIGDADHGVTVERGYLAAAEAAEKAGGAPETFLNAAADALSETMGGAIGPLCGMFWGKVADTLGEGSCDSPAIARAWKLGCERVMRIGKAERGAKTMVDAMLPCVEFAQQNSELSVHALLRGMAQAAALGAEATADMVATKGRARFLGEKSLGHEDPGARSFALMMEHLAEAAEQQEA